MKWRGSRTALLVLLIAVAATACRADSEVTATAPTPTATPTQAPSPGPSPAPTPVPSPTSDPEPGPEEPTEPPAATPTSLSGLPGEPWDLYVPAEGEIIAVVGVSFDDILEVHQAPGENTPLVGTLAPLADDVVSTGEGRALPNSIWWRVSQGELEGWVGSRFMSRLGVTNDITAQIVEGVGELPMAETMTALARIVADERSSEEPPSRIVISIAPTVGDLGEITIDVVGLGDDAVEGERLHVFGQPTESGEGFSLKAVEATVMCSRGIAESGLCL